MRVLVVAPDPLARAGLTALLAGFAPLEIVGQGGADRDLARTAAAYWTDALLWDFGWNPAVAVGLLAELVGELPPVVALVADGEAAAQVWAAEVRGLLAREANAETIAAALLAIGQGLLVIDPAFAWLLAKGGAARAVENPVEPLTPRELDVLHGLAEGLANKEIARRLGISEHTVKFHLNALMGKLGAQSRTDAVVRAMRAGVILL